MMPSMKRRNHRRGYMIRYVMRFIKCLRRRITRRENGMSNENNIDYERDLYRWRMGYDDEDLKMLTDLNVAIDLLYRLDDIDYYAHRMNVGGTEQELIGKVLNELDVSSVAFQLEIVRTLLIGSKVKYEILQELLERGMPLYGYTSDERGIKDD